MPDDYTIDDIFDPRSVHFNSADQLPLPPSAQNGFTDAFGPGSIASGEVRDYIQSGNFVENETGWRLGSETAEFYTGTFNIGGTKITIDNTQDIQTNLDFIEAAGGGTLYLQPGTYTLTADITIPSGVSLEGVSRDSVIIDCNTSYSVTIVGSDAYNTGTVSISNGDTTVVGVGTTWTSAMVGRYILLDRIWYLITARTDNTHITIDPAYQNDDLSGSSYTIAIPNTAAAIVRVSVTNASGSGIKCQYAMEPAINDVLVYGCGTGIDFDQVVYPRVACSSYDNGVNLDMLDVGGFYIDFCLFGNSTTGAGVVMVNSGDATFFNSSVTGNTTNGISLTGCNRIAFISVTVNLNGGKGIEFISGNSDCQLTDMVIDANTSDGVKLTATTDLISIGTCSVSNNSGYGVNIAASTCDGNQITSPAFNNNTSGNINDAGTSTAVLPLSDVQIFSADGTWTKPAGAKTVRVVCIGGGGSGGGGAGNSAGTQRVGGTAGGGGAITEKVFRGSDLPSTVSITVPTLATGGTAGSGGAGGDGNAGGTVSFGAYLTAYGGGAGKAGGNNNGGSGGGSAGAGVIGTSSATLGGAPASTAGANGIAGQGAGATAPGGAAAADAKVAEYGGGSGGACSANDSSARTATAGGGSLFAAGGGGGGGGVNAGNTLQAAAAGGAHQAYTIGGGGAAGAGGAAGSAGTSRSGFGVGDGGGGGSGSTSTTAGTGGAGGEPGGGGGGGGGGTSTGGVGGAGGRGEVRVFTS